MTKITSNLSLTPVLWRVFIVMTLKTDKFPNGLNIKLTKAYEKI